MSQISIDRELLHRILDEYFELRVEARAFLGLQQHTAVRQSDPTALVRFLEALEKELENERSESQGIRERLVADSCFSRRRRFSLCTRRTISGLERRGLRD